MHDSFLKTEPECFMMTIRAIAVDLLATFYIFPPTDVYRTTYLNSLLA